MTRLAGSAAGRWAVGITAGVGAGVAVGFVWPAARAAGLDLIVLGAGAMLMLAVLAGLAGRKALALSAVVLVAGLLGMARGALAVEAPGPGRIDGHLGSRPIVVSGTVRLTSPTSRELVVDVQRVSDAESDQAVTGGLLVSGRNLPALAPGDQVLVQAPGVRPPGRRPGPQSEATLEREGVQALAPSAQVTVTDAGGPSLGRLIAWVQGRLVEAVNGALPEPGAALLLGIAFGIRQPLAAVTRAPLQDAGLIHIVVVSGLKVVMVLGLVAAVARVLDWSPRRTLATSIPIVAAYVLISGSGPAAVRSALMAGAAMLALSFRGRRTDPLPMLALVGAAMLGVQPALVLDPGFQLSFLGTAGIMLLASPLARRLPGPRLLVEPFATTVAAQAATVPVMAGTFGVIALAGPIANALVLPMLPALIVLGGGGAVLGALHPALGWLPLGLAGLGTDAVVAIGTVVAAIPGAAIHVGMWPEAWTIGGLAGLLAAGGLVLWRRDKRRTVALAAAAGLVAALGTATLASRPDGLLHVSVLDVGSSTAVVVRTGDGGVALVDGGASQQALLQAIGRVLPPTTRRIDMLVLTGGEPAAVSGISGVAGHYEVGIVVVPANLTPGAQAVVASLQASGADVVAADGNAWRWGGASWRCLPFGAASTGRSMCALHVDDPSGRVLVLGDAGTADQDELGAAYGAALAADVVVTPPGGAVSHGLLTAARPSQLAVPVAKGAHSSSALPGYTSSRTGVDGDLEYVGGPAGLERT